MSLNSHEPSARRLCAVLCNPPLTSGKRTIGRVRLAAEVIGCADFSVVNLFAWPTTSTNDLSQLGAGPQGWLAARPAIQERIEDSTDYLFAWGVGGVHGAAAHRLTEQASWLHDELATRGVEAVWQFGSRPRHPSRWNRPLELEPDQSPSDPFEQRLRRALALVSLSSISARGIRKSAVVGQSMGLTVTP